MRAVVSPGRRCATLLFIAAALLVGACVTAQPVLAVSSLIDVSRRAGRLTLRVREMPLDGLLRAVAERAGLRVTLRGDLTSPVTASFFDVPLDEGIKRLTRGHSVCLLYGGSRSGPSDLVEAWVFASPTVSRPIDLQRRAMRLRNVRMIGTRRGPDTVPSLAMIIAQDEDEVVRTRAVETLGRFGDRAAAPALVRALLRDPAPSVRRVAARALGSLRTQEARHGLEQAEADGDALVRQEVATALRRWRAWRQY